MVKENIDIRILHSLCDSRRKRSSRPWDFFHKKIDLIKQICQKTRIKDKRVLDLIYKQQIVSLVTALEVYLREIFIYVIDKKNVNPDKLLEKSRKDINLLELFNLYKQIKRNDWSKAEVLAYEYNFQNIHQIKLAFNTLLDVDFFNELRKWGFETKEGAYESLPNDFDKQIEEILDLRHPIVHDINFRKKLSFETFVDCYNIVHFFVDAVDYWIEENTR